MAVLPSRNWHGVPRLDDAHEAIEDAGFQECGEELQHAALDELIHGAVHEAAVSSLARRHTASTIRPLASRMQRARRIAVGVVSSTARIMSSTYSSGRRNVTMTVVPPSWTAGEHQALPEQHIMRVGRRMNGVGRLAPLEVRAKQRDTKARSGLPSSLTSSVRQWSPVCSASRAPTIA